MKSQKTKNAKLDDLNQYLSKCSLEKDYPDRGQQEMKRRLSTLQSRRVYLERELLTVKACVSSLVQQMESYSTYKQLSN